MENKSLKMFTETVKVEGAGIWVRPVCDFFKIDVRNQHRNIKNDPILGKLVEKSLPDLGEIDKNGRILLTKKGFIRWIQIINPSIVPVDLREQFITFQELITDYLYGSIEEHEFISKLNTEIQVLRTHYSEIGNQIRTKQKQLVEALNQRYQYRIDFKEQKQIQ